jgi:hypothetical protein
MNSIILVIVFGLLALLVYGLLIRRVYQNFKERGWKSINEPVYPITPHTPSDLKETVKHNAQKGVFGPTLGEKVGMFIGLGVLVLILNLIIKDQSWQFYILFNLFFLGLVAYNIFTLNVHMKNGVISHRPSLKIEEALISDVVSIHKIAQPGGQGVPSPALGLELTNGKKFEINIEKWTPIEIVEFLNNIKGQKDSITIDPVFNQLRNTKSDEEFNNIAKAYISYESKTAWKAGLASLIPQIILIFLAWLVFFLKK